MDRLRHLRPDALRLLDLLRGGCQQRVDRAELLGEVAPSHVPDLLDPEREQDTAERLPLGGLDRAHQLLG